MLTRNALLPEYRDFLASINPSVYPTFNFGYPVAVEVGQGSLVHFFNRLQRACMAAVGISATPTSR